MTLMEALSILEPMGLKVETKVKASQKTVSNGWSSFQTNETITLEL